MVMVRSCGCTHKFYGATHWVAGVRDLTVYEPADLPEEAIANPLGIEVAHFKNYDWVRFLEEAYEPESTEGYPLAAPGNNPSEV